MKIGDPVCVLHPDDQTPATGGLLCRKHYFDLKQLLNSIRDNWPGAALVEVDDGMRSSGQTFGRTATRVYSPVPIDLGAIDRSSAFDRDSDRLCFWAKAVASSRGVHPSNFPRTTTGQIDLLRLHMPWIMAQPAVADFYTELQEIRRRVAAAVGRSAEKSVGLCRHRTATGRCDGELLRDPAGVVRCHRDPSHIEHVRAKPQPVAE